MSNHRDAARNDVVTSAGHPDRAYAMLKMLAEHMRRKTRDQDATGDIPLDAVLGQQEMTAFVENLASDIARVYGIEREKGK